MRARMLIVGLTASISAFACSAESPPHDPVPSRSPDVAQSPVATTPSDLLGSACPTEEPFGTNAVAACPMYVCEGTCPEGCVASTGMTLTDTSRRCSMHVVGCGVSRGSTTDGNCLKRSDGLLVVGPASQWVYSSRTDWQPCTVDDWAVHYTTWNTPCPF
jgi:hypothetical protein